MRLGIHGDIDATKGAATGTWRVTTTRQGKKANDPATDPERTANGHIRQTLGGKVLSAIALERVTGRKPDPRRFRELD